MRLEFTKMHGLGNDFVVIDLVSQSAELTVEQIRRWGDRHFGVGFDQLLLVEPPDRPDIDFRYRIFNADGSEVAQCGNGARCFARFVHDRKLTTKKVLRVSTASGVIELRITDDGWVTVNMGAPRFLPAEIPFQVDATHADATALDYEVDVEGNRVTLSVANMGNPHAVIRVESAETAPVGTIGALLERHARFPERVNVGFLQVLEKNKARLRVFERGTGETLACGTGACAAAVTGIRQGWLSSPVRIQQAGGDLEITWEGEGSPVIMRGPTARVFQGFLEINEKPAMAESAPRLFRRGSRPRFKQKRRK